MPQNNSPAGESIMRCGQLHWLLDRLRATVHIFEHSLGNEFFPSKETVADWAESLSLLREAAFPVQHFVDRFDDELEANGVSKRRFEETKFFLLSAVGILLGNNDRVANKIASASTALRSAIAVMDDWLGKIHVSDKQKIVASEDEFVPSRDVVRGMIVAHFKRLSSVIDSNVSDKEELTYRRCMFSRKAYLVAHYAATIYPEIWNHDFRKELISLLEKLNIVFYEGSPHRRSIARRLDHARRSTVLALDALSV